jgi:3-hydroxybutyrate dehydrogenase
MTPRCILITGAGSGIGAGVAAELAAAGHHLVVTDIALPPAQAVVDGIRAQGGSAEALVLDVTSDDSVAAALATVSRPVDVLVNNAGLQHVAPLEDFPIDKWEFLVQVMLVGVARLTKAVLPGMRERGFGRIVNIGSIHSLVASPYKSAYVAAKHGLVGFSKVIALETADTDITINTICPTYVKDPAGGQTDRGPGAHARHPRGRGRARSHAQTDAEGRVHHVRGTGGDRRVPDLPARAQHHRAHDRGRRRLDGAVERHACLPC